MDDEYYGTCIRCGTHLYSGWHHCCGYNKRGELKVCESRAEYCENCKGLVLCEECGELYPEKYGTKCPWCGAENK